MMFNPNEHLTGLPRSVKKSDGTYETVKDDYLEVKWRLVWFREQCPQGVIFTEEIFVDLDREVSVEATRWVDDPARPGGKKKKEIYAKTAKGYARYRAIVRDGKGAEATGTKSESAVDFPDFIEKAETGAIGRALAALGFGTQFTGDEFKEHHRIVDAPCRPAECEEARPVERKEAKAAPEKQRVPLAKLKSAAEYYYPGAWAKLCRDISEKYNFLQTEQGAVDELIYEQYNDVAQALLKPHMQEKKKAI